MKALGESAFFVPGLNDRLERSLEMKLNFGSDLYAAVSSEEMLDFFISDMRSLHDFIAHQNRGECFTGSKRRIVSSFAHLSPQKVKFAFKFPREEEDIYRSMIDTLSCRSFDAEYLARLADHIYELYGYR